MKLRVIAIAFLAVVMSLAYTAIAQNRPRRIVVTRGGGARLVQGSIKGYDDVRYQVAADATGVLHITLKGVLGSNLFNVYAPGTEPGKDEAVFKGASGGTKAEVPVSKAGDYLIQVFLMRNSARRGTTSRYTLSVELTK